MDIECSYGFGKKVDCSFSEATNRVEELLNTNGFIVHYQVNMGNVFSSDRELPFNNYVILGACRSDFAERAFNADHNIGLLLPCNVIVYEETSDVTKVMVMDPIHIMEMVRDPSAIEVAIEVKAIFEEIIEQL